MRQRVCITGAGSGIGRAVAQRFAEDGADLVLIGRRPEALALTGAEATDAGAHSVQVFATDLREPSSSDVLREAADGGAFDAVIAAAGGNVEFSANPDAGMAATTWQWVQNFRTNVLTAVHTVESLRSLGALRGSVVLFSSIAAFRGSGSGSYAAAKAALHPYAFDLAREMGPDQVTVNVVAPGYIAGTEFFQGRMTAEREEGLARQALTQRNGTPQDVAATVHWLCSRSARHITGQIIQVNAGASLGR